jgi:hypothetical protein
MPRTDPSAPDPSLTRELRRLGWGLVIYFLLVLGIGLWALRLGLTHRRFKPLTGVPTMAGLVDSSGMVDSSGGDEADSSPVLRSVHGEVP